MVKVSHALNHSATEAVSDSQTFPLELPDGRSRPRCCAFIYTPQSNLGDDVTRVEIWNNSDASLRNEIGRATPVMTHVFSIQ